MAFKQLTPDDLPLIWAIRHEAMYPGHLIDIVKLDNDAVATHFGFAVDGKIISVVSVENIGTSYQFRKFATLPAFQNKGYGTQLLNGVLGWIQDQGAENVWCNARQSAADYYKKFGLTEDGQSYEKYGLRFVIMKKTF
ncbi:GNAT family N-acetyltransferase [Gynurincola endophyticus]|uniref:GNAT family N-acetyltransferase n=1 Tax=Gynurincola endophyticus TaxID=2479004 RepID=UPI000F8C9276|nr:GNAT family N-acetyltransferase [Gynurincola endophyticus]